MSSSVKKRFLSVFSILILSLLFLTPVRSEEIIFYPTDVTEAANLSYLGDSVRLMLAGRLADSSGMAPRFEDKKILDCVDCYHLKSKVVSKGGVATLSAEVFSPSGDHPLVFSAEARDDARVITALDKIVADIGEAFFDVVPEPVQSKPAKEEVVVSDFRTPHPDRQLKNNSGYGLAIYQEADDIPVRTTGLHKSPVLHGQIRGMTAGDIDGDGLNEILLASNGKLSIYQLRHGRIEYLEAVQLPGGLKVHALNVGDIDKNGIQEIYVSATSAERISSQVLEWSPKAGAKWLHRDVPRYLRPVSLPGEGLCLVGQNKGVEDMVKPGIFRMVQGSAGELEDGEVLTVPDTVNLFDFVFGDTNGNGSSELIVINKNQQIQVYNSKLESLFTTEKGYGGRNLYYGLSKQELRASKLSGMDGELADRDYVYIPIRLVAADVNGDGRDEIVFAQNEKYSPDWFSDTVLFENGLVRMLTWDGVGMVELFHTNTILNSIVDFQFINSDKKQGGQLFIVEPGQGDLLSSLTTGGSSNRVLVYDLELAANR